MGLFMARPITAAATTLDNHDPGRRSTRLTSSPAASSAQVPLLIGPIVAPLIGGGVATKYSWRATFVVLVRWATDQVLVFPQSSLAPRPSPAGPRARQILRCILRCSADRL